MTGLVFHQSERLTLALIPADKRAPCVVLPAMELAAAQAATRLEPGGESFLRFYPWSDSEGPHEALRQALLYVFGERQSARHSIAVEYTAMRVMELHALETMLTDLHTVDTAPLLASMRMIKGPGELAIMTEAVRIIETALQRTLTHIKPGMTELQLAAIFKNEILTSGAEGESFACIVAGGPNSANPHHHNGNRPFQAGDLILLDGGALYQGYASDITRTVALGPPDNKARAIYDLVLAANAAGRAAVRPGVSGEQIDQAARQVIATGGYGDYFLHRTGHGLGMECHELPNIAPGSTEPLPVGATFTIEPGIYVAGVGGVRIEDDVVVTEDGGKSLTSFSRDLLVLPLEEAS
jgi:Xaa-Pro aminopeptidase